MTKRLGKDERLVVFYHRLTHAPAAKNADDAKRLLDETLNQVEDELTDVPNNPDDWRSDGRMYPAQEDALRDVQGRPDLRRYRHVVHDTFIRDNGAIELVSRTTSAVVFSKVGADGRGVTD